MNACAPILLDNDRLAAALARFPRDWPMWIDGREFAGEGGTIERLQSGARRAGHPHAARRRRRRRSRDRRRAAGVRRGPLAATRRAPSARACC